MVAEIKKQPFKATLEFQQRYGCLNNAYQKIPKPAQYFFIDVHGEADFTSCGLMRNHDGIYVATNQNKMVRKELSAKKKHYFHSKTFTAW